jgi:hypothetical protein
LSLAMPTAIAYAADLPPSMVTIERFAAERGDADAQYFMGEHRELGDSGLEKDFGKAREWYEKAAQQNHAAAQYRLGVFHEKGWAGLQPQLETAKAWYRRSAEKGYPQAQQRLAEFDAAKLEAETKRQEQRKAELERQEQQRRLDAEKARARELQLAKAAPPPAPAMTMGVAAARKEKPAALGAGPLLEHVLASKWYDGAKLAEFLPTTDMSCLKTGEREVTCFSKDRRRVVTADELTFSLKAVLHNFADNSFDVAYTYHVSAMKNAASAGSPKDEYGLLAEEGWQQPGQSAKCLLRDRGRVECRGMQNNIRNYAAR